MKCPFCGSTLKKAAGQSTDLLYCPEELCGWTHVALPEKIWKIIANEKIYRHKCYAYEGAFKAVMRCGGDETTLARLKEEAHRICADIVINDVLKVGC